LDEGKDVDGKDSIATQLAEHTHWDDLVIIIAVVRSSPFNVPQGSGHFESLASLETVKWFAMMLP
jgi:diphosphomevalonate decarboxylase